MSEAFYDNFNLKLDNVQVIVAGKGTKFNVGCYAKSQTLSTGRWGLGGSQEEHAVKTSSPTKGSH